MNTPFKSALALAVLSCALVLEAAPVGAIVKLSKDNRAREYTLTTDQDVRIKVSVLRPDIIRIQAAPKGEFADPKNDPAKAQIVVLPVAEKRPEVKVKESDGAIEFATDKAVLKVAKADGRCELQDAAGKVLWTEVQPLDIGETTAQTLSSGPDEWYYGGGQQNGYFSHKGTKIDIKADGNWNEGGHPNPAPFYMSSQGYGVLRNTFATGNYDFTANNAIRLVHDEKRFDAYYFVGGNLHRIVDLYTQCTGRPNFVAIWALELGEADAYMTRDPKTKLPKVDDKGNYVELTPDCVSRCAEKYRLNDMPGGWILPNDGYGCGYVCLPEVVKDLAALGFHTGLWTERSLTHTDWEVGKAGVRVQKLDVAWTGPAYQFSLDANRQAWSSLTRNSDSRGFVWTVQGWAGTQRYSVCWTGDQYGTWDLIRYHIPTLVGSGLSGQAYATTDVDGIFGGCPETFVRDLQWKCFTPVLYVMNGWSHINKSPWSYDEPYRSIFRDYLKLKLRMTPYMYKYTREAYDTGAPVVRGMLWDFPQDPKTLGRSTQYQYMLGEWLLVAPVYTSMKVNKGWRKEDIYLPKGQWIDYWDGRRIQGPATIDAYPITLEKLPLLVRGGAIIPMYPEMLYNDQKPKDPLTFDIYPYGASSFEMYEDDGCTRKYQQGESARQVISVQAPEGKAGDIEVQVGPSIGEFTGKLKSRVYQFQIHSELKPLKVEVDGSPLRELADPQLFAAAAAGWRYDPADRRGIVHVKLARASTEVARTLRLDIDETQAIAASPSYPVPVVTADLDKTEFTVSASSEQGAGSIRNAFDGTPETMWHSKWGDAAPAHPFTVDVGLNGLYPVNGFSYMARQDLGNGLIADYEIYVSRVKDVFGAPVAKGTFVRTKDVQSVAFPTVWGRYVRLKILSGVGGNKFASAAEFDVLQDLKAAPLADEVAYLSDLEPASVAGVLKKDLSAGGKPISVNEQPYKKGLGVQAPSEVVYKLDGTWDRLSGHVGMDDEVGSKGGVMFRVFADGKQVFESPAMNGDNVKQLLELNVQGVKELKLVLVDTGDGVEFDHGDWIDLKLVRTGSTKE